MVIDNFNTFFDNEQLNGTKKTGKVIHTGEGDANNPLFIVALTTDASADASITIETSKTADFATSEEIGTIDVKKDKLNVARVPYGDLGYLRAKTGTNATSGTISAFLTLDAELH